MYTYTNFTTKALREKIVDMFTSNTWRFYWRDITEMLQKYDWFLVINTLNTIVSTVKSIWLL